MQSPIYESFTLPSKGLIYDKEINPVVTLRSMTTMEEMQRLSQTDTPYKVMSDIIEACMREAPGVHVYNMCLGDYQFLLHKLRIVTYGTTYKMIVTCPKCKNSTEATAQLDSLAVKQYSDDIINNQQITLPVSNNVIELRFQTPRDLDAIAFKTKEKRKEMKTNYDYSILYTCMSMIKTVDGQRFEREALENFVTHLPMNDANYLMFCGDKLNRMIGLDTFITVKCNQCGADSVTSFRITPEFFGPTNY